MKFKKIILITLLLLAIFTIGAVSAADDNATEEVINIENDDRAIDLDEKSTEDTTDNDEILRLDERSNETTLTTKEYNIFSTEHDVVLSDSNTKKLTVKPIKVYANEKFTYSVKLTDNDGPISGEELELVIFDGENYCTEYNAITNYNGIATFYMNGESIGTYDISVEGDDVWEDSYIKVIENPKTKTVVKAPKVTAYYKVNKYFKVAVKKGGKAVKNLKLNVKVYTGSKYKNFVIKTNKKGVAQLSTKKFKIGSHKVTIISKNSKCKFSKTSKIVIKKKNTSKYKIITTTAKMYNINKKSGQFTVRTRIYDMTAGYRKPYKCIDVFLSKNGKLVQNSKYKVNYKINGKWTGWSDYGTIETSHHRHYVYDSASIGQIKVKVKKNENSILTHGI